MKSAYHTLLFLNVFQFLLLVLFVHILYRQKATDFVYTFKECLIPLALYLSTPLGSLLFIIATSDGERLYLFGDMLFITVDAFFCAGLYALTKNHTRFALLIAIIMFNLLGFGLFFVGAPRALKYWFGI